MYVEQNRKRTQWSSLSYLEQALDEVHAEVPFTGVDDLSGFIRRRSGSGDELIGYAIRFDTRRINNNDANDGRQQKSRQKCPWDEHFFCVF